MKALFYSVNPMGWATCKGLRLLGRGCVVRRLNGLRLREVPEAPLPTDAWVRVRTRMAGVCGTDLAVVAQRQAPNSILQAYSSLPAVLGHENVGEVVEVGSAVDGSWVGRRVCVEPTLGCRVRGIDPPCPACAVGAYNACHHFAGERDGAAGLPAGTNLGFNTRTGGAFAESFLAHASQLVAVPDELTDEQAVLTDPLACSLHAALRVDRARAERVLIYGAGVLGLGLAGALRALGWRGRIEALDRHAYLRPVAERLGADELFHLPTAPRERFGEIARRTGGSAHRVRFGNWALSGGYDIVFDCVGSPGSFTECLKWTRPHGQTVLLATAGAGRVDLTSLWLSELTVLGMYGRQEEHVDGRTIGTYELTHELMRQGKLPTDGMLTHTFRLDEYRAAMTTGLAKGRHQAVKVAFDFRGNGSAGRSAPDSRAELEDEDKEHSDDR